MGFFYYISFFIFSGFTEFIPHNLKTMPTNGKCSKNLLAKPDIYDIILLSAFIFAGRPKLRIKYSKLGCYEDAWQKEMTST